MWWSLQVTTVEMSPRSQNLSSRRSRTPHLSRAALSSGPVIDNSCVDIRDDALARMWRRTLFVSMVSEHPTTVSHCRISIDNYSPISACWRVRLDPAHDRGSEPLLRARKYVQSSSLDVVC